ncbi:hypothetical protein PR001_g10723 [Phytophthora rubi]|uniref:Uncharacterized protein n=1 Tax=Phytophthora rubi TaxID=129364 RepID=A0A6A3MTN1_9STRA|nr:hypothetical protein PR002_g10806 [Phytophthora rubi]KAE9032190.1 hypothetical protein PR001_g10723 [Phytophthora rubi]
MSFLADTERRTSGVSPRLAPGDQQTKVNTIPPAAKTSDREEGKASNPRARVSGAEQTNENTTPPAETSEREERNANIQGARVLGAGQTKGNTILPATENSAQEETNSSNHVAQASGPRQSPIEVPPVLHSEEALNRGSDETPANAQRIALANPTSPSYESPVISINDLKPAQSAPWAVVARVFARNPVRAWKNFQDRGTLLELYVADSPELYIRATLFNQAVEKFSAITVPGATCYFSGGRVRRAFAAAGASIEISFGKEC